MLRAAAACRICAKSASVAWSPRERFLDESQFSTIRTRRPRVLIRELSTVVEFFYGCHEIRLQTPVDDGNRRSHLIVSDTASVPRNQLRTTRLPGSTTPLCYYYTQNQSKVLYIFASRVSR